MKGERGFTLVELLLALAIAGAIAATLGLLIWQFSILPSRATTSLEAGAERAHTFSWFTQDTESSQFLKNNPSESSVAFEWTDYTLATFNSVVYTYDSDSRDVVRKLFVNGEGIAQQLLDDGVAEGDVTFRLPSSEVAEVTLRGQTIQASQVAPAKSGAQASDVESGLPDEGYALFIKGNLDISGSGNTIRLNIYIGGDLSLSGRNNRIEGRANLTGRVDSSGAANRYHSQPASAKNVPLSLDPTDFSCTRSWPGNVDLKEVEDIWEDQEKTQLKPGVYCAEGTLTLSGSNISGQATLIASRIVISGSYNTLTAREKGVVLYATGSGEETIDLSGSGLSLSGIIYAPNGKVKLSGSKIQGNGLLYAKGINWSGSGNEFTYDPTFWPEEW